ncbi:MAG: VOC family protein [Nocardioidaceae bacterium]
METRAQPLAPEGITNVAFTRGHRLPVADRQTSFTFYRHELGLGAIGDPAEDGVPEPLQFAPNDGAGLMLIPAGGFGWVIGDHEVAQRGSSECVVSLGAETQAGVDELIKRAQQAVPASSPSPHSRRGAMQERLPTSTAMSGW